MDGLGDGVVEGLGEVPPLSSEVDGLGDWNEENNGLLDGDVVGVGEAEGELL